MAAAQDRNEHLLGGHEEFLALVVAGRLRLAGYRFELVVQRQEDLRFGHLYFCTNQISKERR